MKPSLPVQVAVAVVFGVASWALDWLIVGWRLATFTLELDLDTDT